MCRMRVARRATRILHIRDGLIEESEGTHGDKS